MFVVTPTWPALEGEKLLLASVIRRAAYDIAEYRGSTRLEHQKIWRDAYDWMFREPHKIDPEELKARCAVCGASQVGCTPVGGICPAEEAMSFLSICGALKTDPAYIRARTRMMTRQSIKRYQMVEPTHFDRPVEDPDGEEAEEPCERIQRR